MAVPTHLYDEYEELNQTILMGWRGSIAHGMYVPKSDPNSIDDKDVMGICVPDAYHYLGMKKFGARGRGTKEIAREYQGVMWDIVLYEAQKMFQLLTKGNPNVLSLLWLDDNYYLNITEAGQLILNNRDIFTGKHVYRSFTGYAYAQLQKMERGTQGGWQSARRKKMFDEIGYDAKNASHLIRLLRMGTEFLNDGRLYVTRHDAPQLLDIKKGNWALEDVKAEAERWFALAEQAYLKTDLPEKVDIDKVNELCYNVINEALNN